MINSILKNVLENYQLYTIEEEENLHTEIKYVNENNNFLLISSWINTILRTISNKFQLLKKTGKALPEHIRQVIFELL